MAVELITRQGLMQAGFTRMPDVWLYCAKLRRHEYFERWYHQELNLSVLPGHADSEVFTMTIAELGDLMAEAGTEVPLE